MMVFKAEDVPQLSDAWWAIRRGIPTASAFDRIITPAKGDLSSQADDYIAELIADVACQSPNYFTEQGRPINSYAIQQGKDMEPESRRWLAFDAGLDVQEVGFVMTDDLRWGSSPDGMLGLKFLSDSPAGEYNGYPFYAATAKAALELKNPLSKTHALYLMKGGLPVAYRPQCNGHLIVCNVPTCIFVSYSNSLTPLRVDVVRDAYTDKVSAALDKFHQQYVAALAAVMPGRFRVESLPAASTKGQ